MKFKMLLTKTERLFPFCMNKVFPSITKYSIHKLNPSTVYYYHVTYEFQSESTLNLHSTWMSRNSWLKTGAGWVFVYEESGSGFESRWFHSIQILNPYYLRKPIYNLLPSLGYTNYSTKLNLFQFSEYSTDRTVVIIG